MLNNILVFLSSFALSFAFLVAIWRGHKVETFKSVGLTNYTKPIFANETPLEI